MEVAVHSYFATGVALVGAGMIAVSPVVPKPDFELPALPAVHASVPVELTALENPLELVAQLVQQSLANVNALGNRILAEPAPILQQILTNQAANAGDLASDFQQFLANSAATITQDVPQQIQMAVTAFQGGHITDGLNDLVGAVLLPVLGNGLSNLAVISDVFNVLARPVQNLANLIEAGPTILLNGAIAPIIVLSNFVNAIGNGAEGVIGAVQTGNPMKIATALADGAIGLVAAAINSVIDPDNGVIGAVLNLRNVTAQALGAPVAFAAKSSVTDVPSSTAKMLTLSTTSETAQTQATEDAKTPSDGATATSDKDAGSTVASAADDTTDAKDGTATGTDTSSAATDSSASTGTEAQSGSDADGKAASGTSGKGSTDNTDSTDSKGSTDNTGTAKGSTSDSSSSTATKSDNGATKASEPKKDADAGEKAAKDKAGNANARNEKAASDKTAK